MTGPEGIRADFVRMVARPEATFDLARTALLVAAESDPDVDIEGELSRIDGWGDELRSRLAPDWNNLQKLARLRALLFEDLGFRGDRRDYFNPRNSLLHQVLQRRIGAPLTLGIVMLEIGWRVGMPLHGVGFPAHFLVRLAGEPGDLLLDPYARGVSVHREDCHRILSDATGGRVPFEPGLIASVGKRDMIVRLLNNLKNAYVRRKEDALALGVVDRLLILDPHDTGEMRDRGLLLFRLHEYAKALDCLTAYLEAAPNAADRDVVEKHAGTLRRRLASLN